MGRTSFIIIGIIGYFTIQTVAGWIIQTGAQGNITASDLVEDASLYKVI